MQPNEEVEKFAEDILLTDTGGTRIPSRMPIVARIMWETVYLSRSTHCRCQVDGAEKRKLSPYLPVQSGIPIKLSATPGTIRTPARPAGADNDTVLAALGRTPEAIAGLQAAGAI